MLYLDQEGWVIWADTDAAELLRWPVEELVGLSVEEVLGGDEASIGRLRALLQRDPPTGSCELRVWRATGGWSWLRADLSDQTHPAFGGVRAVLFDIGRQRWLDDARELLLATTGEAMWVVDQTDEVIVANPVAARQLGVSPELFAGPLPAELVGRFEADDGGPLTWLQHPVEVCLIGDATEIEQLVAYHHPDGTDRCLLLRLTLHARDGEPRAVVSLLDLSQPERLQAHLERAAEKSRRSAS